MWVRDDYEEGATLWHHVTERSRYGYRVSCGKDVHGTAETKPGHIKRRHSAPACQTCWDISGGGLPSLPPDVDPFSSARCAQVFRNTLRRLARRCFKRDGTPTAKQPCGRSRCVSCDARAMINRGEG